MYFFYILPKCISYLGDVGGIHTIKCRQCTSSPDTPFFLSAQSTVIFIPHTHLK